MAASMQQPRPIAAAMKQKIEAALRPTRLDIVDESYKHAGHSGNPSGNPDAETHFRCGGLASGRTCVQTTLTTNATRYPRASWGTSCMAAHSLCSACTHPSLHGGACMLMHLWARQHAGWRSSAKSLEASASFSGIRWCTSCCRTSSNWGCMRYPWTPRHQKRCPSDVKSVLRHVHACT